LTGLSTIIAVVDYLLELRDKLAGCCYDGCLREYFDTSKGGFGEAPDTILEGSVHHFAIYSLNRLMMRVLWIDAMERIESTLISSV